MPNFNAASITAITNASSKELTIGTKGDRTPSTSLLRTITVGIVTAASEDLPVAAEGDRIDIELSLTNFTLA